MKNRAKGCLLGLAIGDAMGMPASFMSPEEVKKNYGRITDFLSPSEEQSAHGGLEQAEITDDTQESLIIAEVLIEAGCFDETLFIKKMKAWALDNGMLESTVIGPSTRRFLTAIIEGDNYRSIGRTGDTNGGAMRVAPVGIFYHGSVEKAIEAAIASALPSHGSKPGLASAAAVAAAVALGVEGGYGPEDLMDAAVEGALRGEVEGFDIPAPKISSRLQLAKRIVREAGSVSLEEKAYLLYAHIGAGMKSYESVPLALGVAYAAGFSFIHGLVTVINIGDDADTNGAITGAVCGAFCGAEAIPDRWKDTIAARNGIDFEEIASLLLRA
jgi:ADP-ribosylglycohydrolase